MLTEINFDGIIGPSHNYAGLSRGNIASASNAGDVSQPRAAALRYSVSRARDLAYRDELAALADDELLGAGRPPLRFIPVVTREVVPGALAARLPLVIADGSLEQAAGLTLTAQDSRILVCGNPQMLDDVRSALVARGLQPDRSAQPGQFATENYW